MQTTTLVNLTGQAIPITLDHAAFRKPEHGFRRKRQTVVDHVAKTGEMRPREVRLSVHGSVTLPANGKLEGLHPGIEKVPQVQGLIASQRVRVVRVREAKKVEPPGPKPEAEKKTRRRGGGRASAPAAEAAES